MGWHRFVESPAASLVSGSSVSGGLPPGPKGGAAPSKSAASPSSEAKDCMTRDDQHVTRH
jgi:hypothetical protein